MLLSEIKLYELDQSLISDLANEITVGYKDKSSSSSKHRQHKNTLEPIQSTHYARIKKFVLEDSTVTPPELKNMLEGSTKNEISAMIAKVQDNANLIRAEFIIGANSSKAIMEVLGARSFSSAHAFNTKIEHDYDSAFPSLEAKIIDRLTARSGPEILANLTDPSKARASVLASLKTVSSNAETALATITDRTKIPEVNAATKNIYADIVEFMFTYITIEKRCQAIQDALGILPAPSPAPAPAPSPAPAPAP